MTKLSHQSSLNKIISFINLIIDVFHNILSIFRLRPQDIGSFKNKLFVSFAKIILQESIARLKTPTFVLVVITHTITIDYLINIKDLNLRKSLKP